MNNCLKMRNLMLKEIPVNVKYATEVKEADIEIALVFSLGNYFLKNHYWNTCLFLLQDYKKIDPAQLKSKAERKHETLGGDYHDEVKSAPCNAISDHQRNI